MRKTFAQILSESSSKQRKSLSAKVPLWADIPSLELPTELCTQQCSSQATAIYKADVVTAASTGAERFSRIADLTGGLGVDSWFFARALKDIPGARVLHNEMNEELSMAVRHNFEALEKAGLLTCPISFSTCEITPSTVEEILESFKPDTVFMDPARRSAAGGKVFRLQDCSPNVLELLGKVFSHCERLVLKLSPMADIDLIVSEIESSYKCHVSEVHIVGTSGECKELLLVVEGSEAKDEEQMRIFVSVDSKSEGVFSFSKADSQGAKAAFVSEVSQIEMLFEPSAALRKSGAFSLISERYNLPAIGSGAHLFACSRAFYEAGFQGGKFEGLSGKWFVVERIDPLSSAVLKKSPYKGGKYEVSARGLQLSSEQLRMRLGVKVSSVDGSEHIFGLGSDRLGNLLLQCKLV